jgi:hypothetical protein
MEASLFLVTCLCLYVSGCHRFDNFTDDNISNLAKAVAKIVEKLSAQISTANIITPDNLDHFSQDFKAKVLLEKSVSSHVISRQETISHLRRHASRKRSFSIILAPRTSRKFSHR